MASESSNKVRRYCNVDRSITKTLVASQKNRDGYAGVLLPRYVDDPSGMAPVGFVVSLIIIIQLFLLFLHIIKFSSLSRVVSSKHTTKRTRGTFGFWHTSLFPSFCSQFTDHSEQHTTKLSSID